MCVYAREQISTKARELRRLSSAAPAAPPKSESNQTRHARKRIVGKGNMLVHIPDESDHGAGDVPTYNVTNSIASGLPSTQILNSSLAVSRESRKLERWAA